MCTNPIPVKNPYYNLHLRTDDPLFRVKDTRSMYLNIPCGHCDECVKVRQMSFVQRVQMEALDSHLFFCTLTYNNQMIPSILTSEGFSVRYFDKSDFTNMLKRLRVRQCFGRPFRFVAVTELGSLRSRPHLHCIFFVKKFPSDTYYDCLNLEDLLFRSVLSEWKRNVAPPVWSPKRGKFLPNRRCPDWKPCCTFVRSYSRHKVRSTFDLHYVNPVLTDGSEADVAFYVSKYMVKESDSVVNMQRFLRLNHSPEEYFATWSLVRPSWFASSGFGFAPDPSSVKLRSYVPSPHVVSYIRDCVSRSRLNFASPKFFNPVDGKSFPLSRFYLRNQDCYSVDDRLFFFDKSVASGVARPDALFIDERDRDRVFVDIDNNRLKFDGLSFDRDDFDALF